MNVLVLLGGWSTERDVSLRSGAAVANALRRLDHSVTLLDPKDANWTPPVGIDVVFIALHGTYGEDGEVQKRLEEFGLPYTGCDAESSRLSFDKVATKTRLITCEVPTLPFRVLSSVDSVFPVDWTFPVVLKPVRQGSSVGLEFVEESSRWRQALDASLRFDSEVLVEPRVIGREVTVGILDGRVLPIVEVRPKGGRYDYHTKYTPGETEYICPASFESEQTFRIGNAALGAFRAVGARDYARVDIMIDQNGGIYVLEVNTLPGMTETSLMPKAAAAAGISFDALCEQMIRLALERATKSRNRR